MPGPPKSRAGVRVVDFPSALVPVLSDHLAMFVDRAPTSLVFTGPRAPRYSARTSTTSSGGRCTSLAADRSVPVGTQVGSG